MGLLPVPEYLRLPRDPFPYVIDELIPVGGLMELYGRPKIGKSYMAMGIALAVSTRAESWLGFPVQRHGPVAYIQLDTPTGEWTTRWDTLMKAGYDLSNIHVIDKFDSDMPFPFNLLDPKHVKWLRNELRKVNPILVILDTLRKSFLGNENDSEVMNAVLVHLEEVIRPAAGLFLAHNRKMQGEGVGADVIEDARGSIHIVGSVDTVACIRGNRASKRRFHYTGRAARRDQDEPVLCYQDPETHLFHLLNDEQLQEVADSIIRERGRMKRNELVEELKRRTGCSRATAYRLIPASGKEGV